MDHPSTITANENIEVVERIVMHDRQISIRRLAEELTIIHEIMNNHMGMKKVRTQWVKKLLTLIQSANRVDCCQELLQQSEVNPAKSFDCIVTGDEFWIHHYDLLSQLEAKIWKRLGEQTPTRVLHKRSAGKIMMIIFWDKDDALFTEYLSRGTTINGPYYASIIERQRSVIVEKGRGKVSRGVLLLHDNVPIHKCKIVRSTFRQAGFIELNHLAHPSDIAPSDFHLFSNLKKFLYLKNFSSDDEVVAIVEDYLTDLNSEFFCKGIQSSHDRWQRVVASEGQYI